MKNNARHIIVVIFFMLFASSLEAQNKRALVIGIGAYPVESGWTEIHGDHDIDIISSFLIENGFAKEHILTLKNEQATKKNIVEQFKKITELSTTGDFVYIHFSGHGQQVVDLDGDEDDGWDEAWIPYDARKTYAKALYEGENHLIDDEINILLKVIKNKIGESGQLLIITDACHSGDSSRGEEEDSEEMVIRGTQDKFEIPKPPKVAKKRSDPIEWIAISACKPYASNYECIIDGRYYGSLSYALYSSRADFVDAPLTQIHIMLNKKVHELVSRWGLQPIQSNFPDSFSEQILFEKR